MNRQELRTAIVDLLKVKFDNVEDIFVFPEEIAESQERFPYVTILFGVSRLQEGTRRYTQEMDILAIDKGENKDLVWKQDQMIDKIFQALHKASTVSVDIQEVDSQNLFKPFGLDMGIYPPFCGVRFHVRVPGALTF